MILIVLFFTLTVVKFLVSKKFSSGKVFGHWYFLEVFIVR